MMCDENSVLGPALGELLKDDGCIVSDNGAIAIITYRSRRLKVERRGDYWYDVEKNLWFYSRSQIAFYMTRPTLGSL